MKTRAILALFAAVASSALCAQKPQPAPPVVTIEVKGPTIVAFFTHVTREQLEQDAALNSILEDFQSYAASVREPFKNAGIAFHVADGCEFRLHIGRTLTTFRAGRSDVGYYHVGYYLIAPGKKPRVQYGVMTDTDLYEVAQQYFGIKVVSK